MSSSSGVYNEPSATALTLSEREACRRAFNTFNVEKTGVIDTSWDLKNLFHYLGYHPSDAQLFSLLSSVDKSSSGKMNFDQFMQIVEEQKSRKLAHSSSTEDDWVNAFIACGADGRYGVVDKDRLMQIVKSDFGLHVDLEEEQDVEEGSVSQSVSTPPTVGGKTLQFEEFMKLLST